MLKEIKEIKKVKYLVASKKLKDVEARTDCKCGHCGKDLSDAEYELHDVITYNTPNSGTSSLVFLCHDCLDEADNHINDIDFYPYLTDSAKESILNEINTYQEKVDKYVRNALLPRGDLETEDFKLVDMTYDSNTDLLKDYIENYNKSVKLPLYGEEGLVEKILKDGRFYCLLDKEGVIELMIPIKPLKMPNSVIINFGNIMINPDKEANIKLYKNIVKYLLNVITSACSDRVVSNIVVACNNKDDKAVGIVKSLHSKNFKVAKIRPGYSLAQAHIEGVNKVLQEDIKSTLAKDKYTDSLLKSKDSRVKAMVKEGKKNFEKVVKMYIEYGGGLNITNYLDSKK